MTHSIHCISLKFAVENTQYAEPKIYFIVATQSVICVYKYYILCSLEEQYLTL